jgi:FAD/FMN-containing dehydrogenase
MTTEQLHTDFGGIRRARPSRVNGPDGDLAAALVTGTPTTLRGAGHSCNGQTVTDGILLLNSAPRQDAGPHCRDVGDGSVEVPASLDWHSLETELNRRGRSAPVLTDYLRLSVGGTLSVGGMGLNSIEHGLQTDQVERIRLIDGAGKARWCSSTDHPELFRFALAGLGQAGLIDRVVLRTVPYLRYAHVHRTHHTTTAELAAYADQVAKTRGIQHYNAYVCGSQIFSETGWFSDTEPTPCGGDDCSAFPDLPFVLQERRERWIAGFPDHVRMWTDYVLPQQRFGEFMAIVDELRSRAPLVHSLKAMYILMIRRPPGAARFAFAPVVDEPVSLGLGVYTFVGRNDPLGIVRTRHALRALLELCCDLGGRPYLYGTNDLDAELLSRLYGPDLGQLAALRSQYHLEHINAHALIPQRAFA